MFSIAEKQKIAAAIDAVIKEINHPEMDNVTPNWSLRVDGKESWSFANIHPNHEPAKGPANPWNELLERARAAAGVVSMNDIEAYS